MGMNIMGHNTLQAAWERVAEKLQRVVPAEEITRVEHAFYLGAHRVFQIVMTAQARNKPAFVGMMEGLQAELQEHFRDAKVLESFYSPRQPAHLASEEIRELTAIVPVIGLDLEEGWKRLEFVVPLAIRTAHRQDCPGLVRYLGEALQHALILGLRRDELESDLEENADWWREQLHQGTTAEHAARLASGAEAFIANKKGRP